MKDEEIEKCSESVRDKLLQKKIKSIMDSLELEGITKNSESVFQTLRRSTQNIREMSLNFSSYFTKPVLEEILSVQRDLLSNVQLELFRNISKRLNEMSPDELKDLIEEVNKERSLKKKNKRISKIDKLLNDAQKKPY